MWKRLALKSETCHHAIGEPSEGGRGRLVLSGGAENFMPVPLVEREGTEVCRTCEPSWSGERPRALCLRCLTLKAGGFHGHSGVVALPVGQAGLRPQLWFRPGAKQIQPAAHTAVDTLGIAVCLCCSGEYENTFPCSHQESRELP